MLRKQLDNYTQQALQEEVIKCGLPVPDTREKCIDAIMAHFERSNTIGRAESDRAINTFKEAGTTKEDTPSPKTSGQQITQSAIPNEASLPIYCSLLAEQIKQQQAQINNQQETMRQLLEALSLRNGNQNARVNQPSMSQGDRLEDNFSILNVQQQPTLATTSPAQAVQLLSSQIPDFSGSEDENVELWIKKIEKISQIHGVSSNITFLAATSKLKKLARRWYDANTGSAIESWTGFKEAIIKIFKKKILFHVAMQKVEARVWNFTKESF